MIMKKLKLIMKNDADDEEEDGKVDNGDDYDE